MYLRTCLQIFGRVSKIWILFEKQIDARTTIRL